MKIVIDTREQAPWHFPPEFAETRRGTLICGDYALDGDDRFAIERKTIDDFTSTITVHWKRFQRELERMKTAKFAARCIIVETDLREIIEHKYNQPCILPKFILKRIAELTLQNVSILFGSDPSGCTGLAYSIFIQRQRTLHENGN